MRTYSRRNQGSHKNSDHDAVFSAVCKHSIDATSSPTDTSGNNDENLLGSKKRKNVNSKSKPRELKKLKPTKSEQVIKKKKIGKSDQAAMESNGVALSVANDDPLFGDGPILLEETKKPPTRRKKNTNSVSKVYQEKGVEVNGASVSLRNKRPPNQQVGSEDKVSQWLAGSRDADPVPHNLETSVEIFREVHETADERRHHMFLDHDILGNLHIEPTVIGDKKILKANRDNFLAKFGECRQKSLEPTIKHTMQESRPTKTPGSSRKFSSKRQSWNQEDSTELGSTYTAETGMSTPITGLISTRSHVSDTPNDLQSTYTETQTTKTDSSRKKKTTAQISKKKYMSSTMRRSSSTNCMDTFPSELSTVTESLLTKNEKQNQDEKTPQRYTNDFKVPGSPTKSGSNKTQKKGALQPRNSTQLFTTGFVEIVNVIPQMSTIMMDQDSRNTTAIQKAVSNKADDEDDSVVMKTGKIKTSMKTSTPNKANLPDTQFHFDTDISSVTMDSGEDDELVFNQSSREVCSAEILHLSTTRIEEIVKDGDKIDVTKHDDDDERQSQNHGTPQSAEQDSVKTDRTVTKRRKSSAKKPDVHIVEPTIQQNNNVPSQVKRRRQSTKNANLYTIEQSAVNTRHPMSLKLNREKNLNFLKGKDTGTDIMHNKFDDMFGNPKRTLRFSSISSTPRNRPGQLRFSSEKGRSPVNQEKGCSPVNLENDPDLETGDNSVFESEPCGEVMERNVPVCPLMKDFVCPRKNVSMFVFKTNDTRSFEEIRRTVSVDDIR